MRDKMLEQKDTVNRVRNLTAKSRLPYNAIADECEISRKVFYNWLGGNRFLTNTQLDKVNKFVKDYAQRNYIEIVY